MSDVATGPGWELRCGRWQDVLADVEADALISDPPYSERTHGAYRKMESIGKNPIRYKGFDRHDVDELSAGWSHASGWMVILTDHKLAPLWERAIGGEGRYVFSPIACMEPGSRVRLSGDGPAQWSVWAIVARPKNREYQRWGALPGGYVVPACEGRRGTTGGRSGITGGKPLWLMRALVRDYSKPGDLIVDPCAGSGTTLLAAVIEGRRAIGSEMDPRTFELAVKRLRKGYTPDMFTTTLEERKAE